MRLGYAPGGRRTGAEAVAIGRAAEAAGFAELWLSEDYCERGAFAVAGAVAATTSRLRVGLGVVNPWTRHPALLAMETAGLAEIAGGRVLLGLGASNARWMQEWLGIPFTRPIGRLRECVDVVRQLLAGQRVRGTACGYDLDVALNFVPAYPDVPIVLGVKGPKALAMAGDVADGVFLSVLSSPDYIRWARERSGGPQAQVSAYVMFSCDEDGPAARAALRPQVAKYLGIHGDHDITRVAGLDPELGREFRRRMLAGEPAAELVTDDILDTFAIAGDTEHCVAGLRRYADAGLDSLVIVDEPSVPAERALTAAARCAQRAGILPAPPTE
ncbi:MAG: Luciferase-like, subgroup [Dactylosporangium sp.]|nr:Luciferase-like, subgroup [Dactylosporangium sp.]